MYSVASLELRPKHFNLLRKYKEAFVLNQCMLIIPGIADEKTVTATTNGNNFIKSVPRAPNTK